MASNKAHPIRFYVRVGTIFLKIVISG